MATLASEIPSLARDQAFEALYRRYVKDVYHYALALLRNPADAEDVTQTTFMNAYRAYKGGEEPLKPQNWLIKIAHNAARTRYAAASRRVKEVPLDDHLDQLSVGEADRPDVEAVLEALGRLPLNQRGALVMRELEGRTYAEIAETLGVSVAAVETLIFRARRSLRLKVSSVRALGLVPLPGSLAQLFESGTGAAVGGSAVLGSGFLLKAAIAVVAGAVASSVVGADGIRGVKAAAQKLRVVPAPLRASNASFRLPMSTVRSALHHRRPAARHAAPGSTGVARSGAPRADSVPASDSSVSGASAGGGQSAVQPATSAPVVSNVTSTIQQTAASLPPVNVSLPQAPSVPSVQLPAAPPPPPLP